MGHLFEQVAALDNLERAARCAQRGKRYRPDVLRFHYHEERNLLALRDRLIAGDWQPSDHRHFKIFEPKPRLISAAPYPDRVVHHAIYNVIAPTMERGLIHDCWANRTGKGAHRAVLRFQRFASNARFVLKVDIAKYFPSIDHRILLDQFRATFKDRKLLELLRRVVEHAPAPQPPRLYFAGDDLFSPWERPTGLPIGNLTSQLWANTYLAGFDRWVKQGLRAPAYLRFVDDFALFADDVGQLRLWSARIAERLARLRLKLHPRKTVIRRTSEGSSFLGYVITPKTIRVRGETVRRFRHRLRGRRCSEPSRRDSIAAWYGHVGMAGTYRRVPLN